MTYPKPKLKVIAPIVVVLVAVTIGYFAFGPSSKEDQAKQGEINPELVKAEEIEAGDFKYTKPDGWGVLSKEFLDSESAVNGIATVPLPTSRFTVGIELSVPPSEAELKDSTQETLKKLQNFELINSGDTTVDGKSSHRFTYRFGDKVKTKQELTVLIYKDKVFLLKFVSPDSDFDKKKTDFDKIISSFKFK